MNWKIYVGIALMIISLHVVVKTILVNLAKKDNFFTSPKIGRIKAQVRAGRIIRYIANLKGLNKHIEEKTGRIGYGETWGRWWSPLWMIYGVRFIGLDSIKRYNIDIVNKEINPTTGEIKITTEEKEAGSIHFQGSYHRLISRVATLEMTEVNVLLSFTTETVHAGRSLKYASWIDVVNRAIDSFTREFIAHVPLTEVNKIKAEMEAGGFVTQLKETLNDSKVGGNPGLKETVGQMVIAVNIEMIDFVDKSVQEAAQAEEKAKRNIAGRIAESEGEVEIAKNEAWAKETRGRVDNTILEGKLAAVGNDPRTLSEVTKWQSIAELKTLPGTLVIGENTPPVIVGK
jgi:hypothetical protein